MCSFFNYVICTKGWDALIGQALVTCPLLKPEMLGSQLSPTTSPGIAWGWGSSPRNLEHCYQKQGSGWVAGKPANDHHSCSLSFHPTHLSHLVLCPWMLRNRFSRHCSFPLLAVIHAVLLPATASVTMASFMQFVSPAQMTSTSESLLKLVPAWISWGHLICTLS